MQFSCFFCLLHTRFESVFLTSLFYFFLFYSFWTLSFFLLWMFCFIIDEMLLMLRIIQFSFFSNSRIHSFWSCLFFLFPRLLMSPAPSYVCSCVYVHGVTSTCFFRWLWAVNSTRKQYFLLFFSTFFLKIANLCATFKGSLSRPWGHWYSYLGQ